MRDDESEFTISSFCTAGTCIGVAVDGDTVTVVDLPDPETALRVTRQEWADFVAGVKNGEFDLDRLG